MSKRHYNCSRSLARDLLLKRDEANFKDIFEYVRMELWDDWRESNRHLSEDQLLRKKIGELSKLLTYDTDFIYNSADDTWSLRDELNEELSKE